MANNFSGFELKRSIKIDELNVVYQELECQKTQARVIHIQTDDPENVFCLSFKTIPASSNGVAHILEHTVLCGSHRFPVKDPFFSMGRRSLNTFMNAFTGDDFTCYPAASMVPKDYFNLLDVYLDAVFFPKLDELSFLQEGHRLDFDDDGSLIRSGIVYNEMKGAMASPDARLHESIAQVLFTDLSYRFNSGGRPSCIPELTHKELRDFHSHYYHPSRCLFYFYGNIPLEKNLTFITEKALSKTSPIKPLPQTPRQKRFSKPKSHRDFFPLGEAEYAPDRAQMAVSFLCCHIAEQEDILGLTLLDSLLTEHDASPLKRAILESKLCRQVAAYMDSDCSEVPYHIIFKDLLPINAPALEELLLKTLRDCAKNGFDKDSIEASLTQLEFSRCEITGQSHPFGLTLFFRTGLLAQHGIAPENALLVHSLFSKLRKKAQDPLYFSTLLHKYFLSNTHRTRVLLEPDKELAEKEAAKEKKELATIEKSLSQADKKRIRKQAKALEERQEAEEENPNTNCLPILTKKDLPKKLRDFSLIEETHNGYIVQSHQSFCNKIAYFDLFFPLPQLNEKELFLLRLLNLTFAHMGCGRRSFEENLKAISLHSGGIWSNIVILHHAKDPQKIKTYFQVCGKALSRQLPQFCALLKEHIDAASFADAKRFDELFSQHVSSLKNRMVSGALKYAINEAFAHLGPAGALSAKLFGLNYYRKVCSLEKTSSLPDALSTLYKKITRAKPEVVLSCESQDYQTLTDNEFFGLLSQRTSPVKKQKDFECLLKPPPKDSKGFCISSPVAFSCLGGAACSYVDPRAPALHIAAYLLNAIYLHRTIREQGGAYGGGASANATGGRFHFYSYRDPNIASTLKAFSDSVDLLTQGSFSKEQLWEAKLEVLQGIEAPIAPSSRAETAFLWKMMGKTVALRSAFRSGILSATAQDIKTVAQELLRPIIDTGVFATFASQNLLQKQAPKNISIEDV